MCCDISFGKAYRWGWYKNSGADLRVRPWLHAVHTQAHIGPQRCAGTKIYDRI